MKSSLAENIKTIEVKKSMSGVRLGTIASVEAEGPLFVDYPGNPRGALRSLMTDTVRQRISKQEKLLGLKVLLLFENDDPERPIIVDTICETKEPFGESAWNLDVGQTEEVFIDGRKITFDAREQIVLQCGKASITLTRAGKVIIKGAYLLNRSTGVNRIQGGSVQLN